MNLSLRVGLALALISASSSLWAGYSGHSVGLTLEAGDYAVSLPGEPPPPPAFQEDFGVKRVDSSTEFMGASLFDVDISDGSIRFQYSSDFGVFGSQFARFSLRDADGTLPEITGVSIEYDSHIGLTPSRVSFDANNVVVDLGNLSIDSGGFYASSGACINAPPGLCVEFPHWERAFQPEFVLKVTFAEVPEPATDTLLGLGLLALVLRRRISK